MAKDASTTADLLLVTHAQACASGFPFREFLAAALLAPPFCAREAADTMAALSTAELPLHIFRPQTSAATEDASPVHVGSLGRPRQDCMQTQSQGAPAGVHLPASSATTGNIWQSCYLLCGCLNHHLVLSLRSSHVVEQC
jgi:hypothetical protein